MNTFLEVTLQPDEDTEVATEVYSPDLAVARFGGRQVVVKILGDPCVVEQMLRDAADRIAADRRPVAA